MFPGVSHPLHRIVIKAPETTQPPGARSKQAFELNGGLGTHIDAPSHFICGGRTVEGLGLRDLIAPAALLSVEAACSKDADYQLGIDDLLEWESCHGRIPEGAVVLMRTGWAEHYNDPDRYMNPTPGSLHPDYKSEVRHFPGFSGDAAVWLVRERWIAGIGVDTISPDAGCTSGFPVHHAVLGADKFILENLNLRGVPEAGSWLLCLPTKLRGAPEAQTRVAALVPCGAS